MGELVAAVGLPKPSVLSRVGGVERWGYVSVGRSTAKRDGYGSASGVKDEWVVQLRPAGRRAAGIWPALPGEVEARWRERFGATEIDELVGALRAVDETITVELPQYLPIVSSAHGMALERSTVRWGRVSGTVSCGRSVSCEPAMLPMPIIDTVVKERSDSARSRTGTRLPHRTSNSPSRWRFRPLSPLTVRFRVEPSG